MGTSKRNIAVSIENSPLPKVAPYNLCIALVGREKQKSGRTQFLVSRDDLRALIAAAEQALAHIAAAPDLLEALEALLSLVVSIGTAPQKCGHAHCTCATDAARAALKKAKGEE